MISQLSARTNTDVSDNENCNLLHHEQVSDHSSAIVVDRDNYRYLVFIDSRGKQYVQSILNLNNKREISSSPTRGMLAATSCARRSTSFLSIGLGGATLEKELARQNPDTTIAVVEHSERLHQIARKYFDLDDYQNISVTIADHSHFLTKTKTKFDIVFFDAFDGIERAIQANVDPVYEKLKNTLTNEGLLIRNIAVSNTERFHLSSAKDHFKTAIGFYTGKNFILIACNYVIHSNCLEELAKIMGSTCINFDAEAQMLTNMLAGEYGKCV